MIDITKKYTTRDGREVTLYAVVSDYVHGRVCSNGPTTWDAESGNWTGHNRESGMDLTPAPREFWVNVYDNGCASSVYESKELADLSCAAPNRIACVRVVEGEGLDT